MRSTATRTSAASSPSRSGTIDAYVGAVGSAGMLVGVSRALKAAGSKARIIALEPSQSPFLTTGKGGAHRVEGTAAGFWPPHLTKDMYDEVRVIDENDGRAMAKRVAKEEGVFAGTSSGVNLVAALDLARELGPGQGRRHRCGRHGPQVPRGRPLQIVSSAMPSVSLRKPTGFWDIVPPADRPPRLVGVHHVRNQLA